MRTVLHFHPALAPVKIGVLPLSKKLNEGAEKVLCRAEQDITTVNLTTEATSVSVTAVRTRSEHRSVLHTISIPRTDGMRNRS